MNKAAVANLLIAAVIGSSCSHHREPIAPVEASPAAADVTAFRRYWLEPAKIAPPSIVFEARTAERGGLRATARPVLPEDAAWNDWPGPESRLFNNRIGLMFEVDFAGEGLLVWHPDQSSLQVNGKEGVLRPAASPDELLIPLLSAALLQERALVDADLVDRTRGAGAFRAAYLGSAEGSLAGVVVFPLPDPEAQIVSVALTIAVQTGSSLETFAWSWE